MLNHQSYNIGTSTPEIDTVLLAEYDYLQFHRKVQNVQELLHCEYFQAILRTHQVCINKSLY